MDEGSLDHVIESPDYVFCFIILERSVCICESKLYTIGGAKLSG